MFFCIQIASLFANGFARTDSIRVAGLTGWALNAILLLFVLATGGSLVQGWKVRSLLNDELTREHRRTAIVAGYWVAMVSAVIVYAAPGLRELSAREATYLIVTLSVVTPLLAFSYLEYRAHRDG